MSKFDIQEQQYEFPYHYLPYLENDIPALGRNLVWGIEYLSYMTVVKDEIYSLDVNSILDVGCGDGLLLNTIQFNGRKLGVDLADKAIQFAKAFSSEAEFVTKDIADISEQFEVVSLIEVLEHVPDSAIDEFVSSVSEKVVPGGYLIVCVPTTVIPLNKKHYRHYDSALLRQHLDHAELSLVSEKWIYRDTRWTRRVHRLLLNKVWQINWKPIWRRYWKWIKNKHLHVGVNEGHHVLQVYRKSCDA